MNNINTPKLMGTVPGSLRNWLYIPQAIAHPNPKGRIMPANPTLSATFQFFAKSPRLTSSPTRNKNRIKPRLATKLRFGIADAGNIAAWKPGIRIMTEGPSMIPPRTSAITRGCRILERGQWRSLQKIMMIPAYRELD